MTAPTGLSEYSIALKAGTLLADQYTIVGVLGRPGGFGITYLAEDIRLDTLVAIKEFLPRELATRSPDRSTIITHSDDHDSSFQRGLQQFLREARTLAKIHHPSVVRVRQFFEANGTAYLVMDYLEGQTLADLVRESGGRLPASRAVEIILRVLDGLHAAHALNIYHRDVKPANIYITSAGGLPVLLDFGAARQATGTSGASMTAVLTPGFAPLEQYGHRGQGPWTDVYATSAVLYHILTGVDPVPATDRVGDETDPMVSPADIDPAIGQTLSDAVMKGLSMAPRGRPQTAREFQDLLREALAQHQGAATAPSVLPALPPETVRATSLLGPRLSSEEGARSTPGRVTPPPSASTPYEAKPETDALPVVVSFKVPRRLLGVPLKVALALTIGVATVVIAIVAMSGGGANPDPIVTVAPDTTPPAPAIPSPPRVDSAALSRRLDSLRRVDSIALALKRTRAVADSIRLANARRADSIRRQRTPAATNATVQAGRSVPPRIDSAKAPARQTTSYSPAPLANPPAPPFTVAVTREMQRLADMFRAGDRRGVSRAFGTDEADRIWRTLDGHPQISATAKVVDTDTKDSTANFFLIVEDRVTKASLFTAEYKATFNPIPGGLRLWTATPQRR